MKKTDKKIENRIINALTQVCESVKHEIGGFKWISHEVNYQDFPQSLKVTCSFESTDAIQGLGGQSSQDLYLLIQSALSAENILLHDAYRQIDFDVQ